MTGPLLAPLGSDPAGALLAPLTRRTRTGGPGSISTRCRAGPVTDCSTSRTRRRVRAPWQTRSIGGWVWCLLDGEGWAVRQGKGPPRGNGSRPQLAILDECRSVTLRAVAVDEGFPDVNHHALLGWVRIERTGKWKADLAWVWSTEPSPTPGRRWWMGTEVGVTAAKALLSRPPDGAALRAAVEAARAARVQDGAGDG